VRDLAGGRATLIDRAADGTPLVQGVSEARISPDGRHAAYISDSPDAPGAPGGAIDHIYVVDLASGDTVLADRATDGTPADDRAAGLDLSGDGSKVAFASAATNLGAGADNRAFQIYVRDLGTGTTTWASVPATGGSNNSAAFEVSIDRAGTRVAFQQTNPQFGFGMTQVAQIFVRDLDAKTTDLASRGPDDSAGDAADAPSLSADGTKLAFQTEARNFPAAVPGVTEVYLRDLTARSTTPVSVRADSATGARMGADEPSLSGNGACVAFRSRSDDLVTPGYGPDFSHVFLRAVSADCPPPAPAGNGDGSGGTGDPPRDTTPPQITGARFVHRRFSVGHGRTALSAKTRRGTTIAFTLSEDARTTIAVSSRRAGRRSGTRCVKPRRGLKRRCTRTVALFSLVRRNARAGANRVTFTGRTATATLKPGRYRAELVARDRAGNRSTPVRLTFTVVR
jgi:Tol biopolymer transport system component